MGNTMVKILKAIMFARLFDNFPEIKRLDKDKSTRQLVIRSKSPPYKTKNEGVEEEVFRIMAIKIECANPEDRTEPYTQETLSKALQEYHACYQQKISEISQEHGFISFIDSFSV
jgi:hypothetical protein